MLDERQVKNKLYEFAERFIQLWRNKEWAAAKFTYFRARTVAVLMSSSTRMEKSGRSGHVRKAGSEKEGHEKALLQRGNLYISEETYPTVNMISSETAKTENIKKLIYDIFTNSIGGIGATIVIAFFVWTSGLFNDIREIPELREDMVTKEDIEDMVTTSTIDPWIKNVDELNGQYDKVNRTIGKIEGRWGFL